MTEEATPDEAVDGHCQCKVGRGIDAYELSGVNDELERRWCGEGRERDSLRELAIFFNQRLLDAALEDAGTTRIDGEVANIYRVLTDDDVSTGVRTQTRQQLVADGVSIETVETQFVSHQTIHTHLTNCLEISRDESRKNPAERRQTDRDRIRALQRRTEVVTTDALDRLRGSDALELSEYDVLVDVTVLCADCGSQYDVGELLDAGGCGCTTDTSTG